MKYISFTRFKGFTIYYRKVIISSFIASVILSAILSYIQSKLPILKPYWYFSLFPVLFYLILITLVSISQFIISFRSFRGLIIEEIIAKWNVLNSDGDISSDFLYRFYNKSNTPIKEIFPDREGFSININYNPVFTISPSNKKVILDCSSMHQKPIRYFKTPVDIIIYDIKLSIEPSIKPNEKISLLRQYDVVGSEKNAFNDIGAFAGIRIFFPTLKVKMLLYCPPHYKIEIIDYFIGDEDGNEIYTEKKKQLNPTTFNNGDHLQWMILFPKNNYRYWINYKFYKTNEMH
jgi:hypothetical protein